MMIKRIASMLIIFCMSVVFIVPVEAKPASWAEIHVKSVLLTGMSSSELLESNHLQNEITREEFAELVVYLYAQAKGVSIESIPQWNPFMDTKNPMVARAYNLGIVNGTAVLEDGRRVFSPTALVTREQMAVMLVNELALLGVTTTPKYTKKFSDESQISDWAYEQLAFATESEIILGIGNNLVAPKDNATREQALTLSHKIALKYNWVDKDLLKPRFTGSLKYGFYRPNEKTSQLQSYVQGKALTFRISYLVDHYAVDIKGQEEDLIHILSISKSLSYDAFVVLKDEIENSYDSISKTFNNQGTLYIEASTGKIQKSPFDAPQFELLIDDALLLTYEP